MFPLVPALLCFLTAFELSLAATLPANEIAATEKIKPFTGKITRPKVRMRLQPSLDSHVVGEFNRDDLLVVVDEHEEFFGILPPPEIRGYVYRTYVIDNIIDGQRVNVRLAPDTDSAIITQLNAGDYIHGNLCAHNSKWYEIALPSTTHLWVCKEYVELIGPPNYMADMRRRRSEASALLNDAYLASVGEMKKPFLQIDLQPAFNSFNRLINNYKDFPEQTSRAREMISQLQDNYLAKKIAYLESKVNDNASLAAEEAMGQNSKVAALEKQLAEAQKQLLKNENTILAIASYPPAAQQAEGAAIASIWQPKELQLFIAWQNGDNSLTVDEFYAEQEKQAQTLQGTIEPYTMIKNRPGDFLLITPTTRQPIAYLYSHKINLSELVGRRISFKVVERPNNGFALPAYLVLSTTPLSVP